MLQCMIRRKSRHERLIWEKASCEYHDSHGNEKISDAQKDIAVIPLHPRDPDSEHRIPIGPETRRSSDAGNSSRSEELRPRKGDDRRNCQIHGFLAEAMLH